MSECTSSSEVAKEGPHPHSGAHWERQKDGHHGKLQGVKNMEARAEGSSIAWGTAPFPQLLPLASWGWVSGG